MEAEHLMTATEVAEVLHVPLGTIYAWRYRGNGPPAYRIGKHLRYREQAVKEWIEAQADARPRPSP